MVYVVPMLAAMGFVAASLFEDETTTKRLEEDGQYKDFKEDGSDGDQCISINNYMKVWEVLDLKEEAGGMGAGSFATVAMPLFTGKKGKAHHKAAKAAVGLKDSKKTKDPVYSNMIRRNP